MADPRICSVDDCGKPMLTRQGYCQAHYLRWRRYGDPTGGGPPKGYATKWLNEVAIPYRGEECLEFPFYRASSGHGRLSGRTGPALAHVFVAERVLGPKPSPNMETCHDCGNAACVNARHLYWGTRAQNMADRKRHGGFIPPPTGRGSANSRTKLTEDQVREIRARLDGGATLEAVANAYGLTVSGVHAIKQRRTWSHI